jgi:hypothetical protein
LRHNLPAAVTSFVGRHRELAGLDAALSRSRLVTLTGPGGAGKTRLAIELGRRRAEDRRHPDGVWFVELADLRADEQVVAAVAAAIGLRLPGGDSGVAAVVDRLHAQRVLVVLDNCEHLVTPAAALTARLLAGCPGVIVLATGREPLRVPGEVRSEPVSLICRRLDGIPLALELAAARLAHLSAAELAARLDNALSLLSYGPPGRLDRQHTLAATIGWSYELLTASERALFRRLSVFAGGFDLDAVEQLGAGGRPDPVGTLSRLIGRHGGPGTTRSTATRRSSCVPAGSPTWSGPFSSRAARACRSLCAAAGTASPVSPPATTAWCSTCPGCARSRSTPGAGWRGPRAAPPGAISITRPRPMAWPARAG